MSWKHTRFSDDTVDARSSAPSARPPAKPERRSSYSLDRFLQEPDDQELSPASSVEARSIDTAEFARRRKRMQSSGSGPDPYAGHPGPVPTRRPRLLLMGQRRYGAEFHCCHLVAES